MSQVIDKQVIDQATTAFIRARIQLLQSKPFYAHLVLKLELQWMDYDLSMTDGTHLGINPATYIELSKDEQVSVLVHEVLHCAAFHLQRVGARDKMRWNIAGDVYISNVLKAEEFASVKASDEFMVSIGVRPGEFQSMTTEQIYENLPSNEQMGQSQAKSGKGKGQSGSSCGHQHWQGEGGCYSEANSSTGASQMEQKWKQAVVEAGQMAGNEAGAWTELVKAAMPKPPFHVPLMEFLHRGLGGDSDWSNINRRFISRDQYLPQEYSQVMGEIAIAVDTSGSMDQKLLQQAFGYIRAFREEHACRLHLIQCDHDCIDKAQYQVYEEHNPLPSEFKVVGRGGTSFDPPFALMGEKRVEPRVLIYITDGYGACGAPKPGFDVMWVVIGGNQAFTGPFGTTIHVS